MKKLIGIFILMLAVAVPVQAKEVAGVEIPATLDAGGVELVLNGAGVRTKFFMDIYAGGLYLLSPSSSAKAIIAADEPMGIRLHIVSRLVGSDDMEEAVIEGFDNATRGRTGAMEQHIEAFVDVFREPISNDDTYNIVYEPNAGVHVYKNGEFKGTVEGDLAFKQALFGIWLGDKPAHGRLKNGMLGK